MPVDKSCEEYDRYYRQWERCRDCYEGGDKIKSEGAKYLPMLDTHKFDFPDLPNGMSGSAAYEAYKERSVFFNALGRTVDGFTGLVFQKPLMVKASDIITKHTEDVTLAGESIETFAWNMMKESLLTNRYGVLVEMPREERADSRPYWVLFKAEDIINWCYERIDGKDNLVLVVLKDTYEDEDGSDEFTPKIKPQFRVLQLIDKVYTQSIWRKNELKGTWEIFESGITPTRRKDKLNFIPFELPDLEKPPMLDLADLNIAHYRVTADLKHALHKVALPTPYVCGDLPQGKKGPLVLGSAVAWHLSKGSSAGMLEVSGGGFAGLREDLQETKREMATLGARLLEESPSSAETFGAVSLRHAGEHASVRSLTRREEEGLTRILQWHAWWIGPEETPADCKVSVELNKSFLNVTASPAEINLLTSLLQDGKISYKTFYYKLSHGGWTRPGVEEADELAEIKKEEETIPRDKEPVVDPPVEEE